MVKMQETWIRSLSWEKPLEKEVATHSSILGIPWCLTWQRICLQCGKPGFDPWVGKIPRRRERLPSPVFWPGESSVQLLSRVRLFVTPWTVAHKAFLSITNSWSLLKLMSIESVMPSNHLILCRPLLLLPSIFPSIRVFSNESVL